MGNPNVAGSPSWISPQVSPPSRLRYTPPWFWRNISSGRAGLLAILCTHWPNSGWGSGSCQAWMPVLEACHDLPPSSVR